MKKLAMISMVVVLLLTVSCKKEKNNEVENAGSGFRATVENHQGNGKTHLDGTAVKWDGEEVVLVKSFTCSEPKRFTSSDLGAIANFDAAESLPQNFYAPPYTAYYPGFEVNQAGVYFSGDQLTLPAFQTYVEGSFAKGANPMAVTTSETLLPFKNVCGVLKLQLYGTEPYNVDNITIRSNTGEQLWGTGAVTFIDGFPSLGTLSDGGSTLQLNCNAMSMSTNSAKPSEFCFVVPANTLGTKFTVKVTDTDGNVWSKTANAPQNLIGRSKIKVLPPSCAVPMPPVYDWENGKSPLPFSVSSDKEVYFSHGNLQYRAQGGDDSNATESAEPDASVGGTWRFAENQYDYVGDATSGNVSVDNVKCNNASLSKDYNGWIDLFGWGTSGYNHGAKCYQPWSTKSNPDGDFTNGDYLVYGEHETDLNEEGYSGLADWGRNTIQNGGDFIWFTLSADEWEYLINLREGATNLCGEGIVEMSSGNFVKGLIILPDDWSLPGNLTFVAGNSFSNNFYDSFQWMQMEGAGAVFLPAAGIRQDGTSVIEVMNEGVYWSSTAYYLYKGDGYSTYYGGKFYFEDNEVAEWCGYGIRYEGYSVRLVTEGNEWAPPTK